MNDYTCMPSTLLLPLGVCDISVKTLAARIYVHEVKQDLNMYQKQ